jgi:hypothetical protein
MTPFVSIDSDWKLTSLKISVSRGQLCGRCGIYHSKLEQRRGRNRG